MTTHHLVLPNELNHHQTLFGGVAMALADKAAYMVATLEHPDTNFVTKVVEGFNFLSPAEAGDILETTAVITETGHSSITIKVGCANRITHKPLFDTTIVMVNMNPLTKRSAPIP
jgi:acyl-CoA hydrolase